MVTNDWHLLIHGPGRAWCWDSFATASRGGHYVEQQHVFTTGGPVGSGRVAITRCRGARGGASPPHSGGASMAGCSAEISGAKPRPRAVLILRFRLARFGGRSPRRPHRFAFSKANKPCVSSLSAPPRSCATFSSRRTPHSLLRCHARCRQFLLASSTLLFSPGEATTIGAVLVLVANTTILHPARAPPTAARLTSGYSPAWAST